MAETETNHVNLKSSRFWVIVLLMGIGVGVIAGVMKKHSRVPVPDEGVGATWVWICLISWSICVALGYWFYQQLGGGFAHLIQHDDALVLIGLGRLKEATEIFTAYERDRKNEYSYPFYANSLAVTLIQSGKFQQALTLLQSLLPRIRQSKWLSTLEPIILSNIAIVSILSNDLNLAEATLLQIVPDNLLTFKLRTEIEVMIALRRGEVENALNILTERWSVLERASSAHLQKVFRILRAFAEEQNGTSERNGEIDILLDGVRPSRVDEYDYMCGNWPQMSDFLVRKNLKRVVQVRDGNG